MLWLSKMTLDQLIRRFEAGKVTDADFEHPLARDIVEELAQCKESEVQRALFGDARKLADHIIERYVRLDREDKLKMAEAYQAEEYFQKIGGIPNAVRQMLIRRLGDANFELLSRISNYSKLIPILRNYVEHIEEKEDLGVSNSGLSRYLRRHDIHGEEVKVDSSESMHLFTRYDFKRVQEFKKRSSALITESVTFGIPGDLKQRVLSAESLLKLKTRILENYVAYVAENKCLLSRRESSLSHYLSRHDIYGK